MSKELSLKKRECAIVPKIYISSLDQPSLKIIHLILSIETSVAIKQLFCRTDRYLVRMLGPNSLSLRSPHF